MKNIELKNLAEQLHICGNLKGVKLSYAIAKNSAKIEREMKILLEELKKLQEQHAKKKDGKPVIKDNVYQMINIDKFNKEYQELMEIDTKIEFHKINITEIPDDINTQQMLIILPFIQE